MSKNRIKPLSHKPSTLTIYGEMINMKFKIKLNFKILKEFPIVYYYPTIEN
jgi:hypothetical protein